MTAARSLLEQCDSRTLSLLVRPTLAMLHTLLESNNAEFHNMAASTVCCPGGYCWVDWQETC